MGLKKSHRNEKYATRLSQINFEFRSVDAKHHFYRVDLEISSNPQILRIFAYLPTEKSRHIFGLFEISTSTL